MLPERPEPRPGGIFGGLDRFASGCWLVGHDWVQRKGWWVCGACGKGKQR